MEIYEFDEKSSPESWSTCDIGSLQDLSGLTPTQKRENNESSKVKNYVRIMFSKLKSQIKSSNNDFSELTNYINSIFYDENPDNLCKVLSHNCCNEDNHGSRCLKKWKTIHKQLLTLVSENPQQRKLIFTIRKRQNPSSKLLLNESQPFWIHRLFLQSFLGNNN